MDEMTATGMYGCMAARREDNRSVWNCYDSSDYQWRGIVDDYGTLVILPGTGYINLRGY